MPRRLEDLARLSARELGRVFHDGTLPDVQELLGWEYRGYNQPFITQVLGFRKFKKGFYERDGACWGYNVPVVQNGLEGAWKCRPSDDAPKRFGFYSVRSLEPGSTAGKESGCLLLDYSDGSNGFFEGSFLRDYVRRVDGDDDLLLGKAYSSVARAQLFPTFFIIERDRRAPDTAMPR